MGTSRFAPSSTGPAHPGTLLAALLGWLDARSRGDQWLVRIEDLDPERTRPEWDAGLQEALGWLGLAWDGFQRQSERDGAHAAALDRLAARGGLYPCTCSRRDLAAAGMPSALGGFAYPGTCRERPLPAGGWRSSTEPLRLRLPAQRFEIADESGRDLSGDPSRDPGDPVVRRRDGAIAYHLAGVVDDVDAGVTRIVRGHDLAATTATQWAIQAALDAPHPEYRHHLLLLEERGEKLAKFHGAVGFPTLREHLSGPAMCGVLAAAAGLRPTPEPVQPEALVADFDWSRVATRDRTLRWTGDRLLLLPATA
ncbi:MAG: glutamate--tRNA ligase family protein [Myxococcota bacterium]